MILTTRKRTGKSRPMLPRKTKDLHEWGGMARWALQAIYTIAFLCLLRSDEVLKIRREHIIYEPGPVPHLVLTLPCRKTHQDGGRSIHSIFEQFDHLFLYNRNKALLPLCHGWSRGPPLSCPCNVRVDWCQPDWIRLSILKDSLRRLCLTKWCAIGWFYLYCSDCAVISHFSSARHRSSSLRCSITICLCRCRSHCIWHTLLPKGWLSVLGCRLPMDTLPNLWMGPMEHWVFQSDNCPLFDLMEW